MTNRTHSNLTQTITLGLYSEVEETTHFVLGVW